MKHSMNRSVYYISLLGLFILTTSCTNRNYPQPSGMTSTSMASSNPLVSSTIVPLATDLSTVINTPIPSITPTVLSTTAEPTPTMDSEANQVRTMLIDQNGGLWTGGPGGVVHWDIETGTYTTYKAKDGLASNEVTSIAQTPEGALWFGTFGAGLSRFDGKTWRTYTIRDGLPGDYILSLAVTPDGILWVDTATKPYKADSGYAGHIGQFNGEKWHPIVGGGFDSIAASLDGNLWGSTFLQGLGYFDGQRWEHLSSDVRVTALTAAPNGLVWVATPTNIYRVVNSELQEVDPPGLDQADTSIATIAATANGIVWFGFSSVPPDSLRCGFRDDSIDEWGVYRYDGENWSHFTKEDGLTDNKICAIVVGPDDSVWFGTYDNGVSHFDGQAWTTYTIP